MLWFISDTHFCHRNAISLCNRPFSSVDVMNQYMVKMWVDRVKPEDTVFHLGDFNLGRNDEALTILEGLPGTKILLVGNHDSKKVLESSSWAAVREYQELEEGDNRYVLCHYPFSCWNGSHRGAINLHGHSHGTHPGSNQQIDVGVDCFGYAPVNLETIHEVLSTSTLHVHKDGHTLRVT